MSNRVIFLKERLKEAQEFLDNANAVIESGSSDPEKTIAELEKETWICQIDDLNKELLATQSDNNA